VSQVADGDPVDDPVRRLLADVVDGRFPRADGGVTVLPPDLTTGSHAALCFTGHAVLITEMNRDRVLALGMDGFGGAHAPESLRALAGPRGWIGVLDTVLIGRGTGSGAVSLVETGDHDHHPRVAYARSLRHGVTVLADERGLVTLGTGLGGRTDLGFEVLGDEDSRGAGSGRSLLRDALAATAAGEPVFASCSPGNARSMRALLAAGFVIVGSEVLIRREN